MQPTNGKAIAALVLGICSFLGLCSPIVGIVCGIVGICLGGSAKSQGCVDSKATAGIILGIIGIIVSIAIWIISYLTVMNTMNTLENMF